MTRENITKLPAQGAEATMATVPAHDAVAPIFAILSHELRTPLSAVLGYAELLREGEAAGLNSEDRLEHTDAILTNARRLQSVISQVLDVFRLQTGTLTLDERDWDAGELLEVAIRNATPRAEARHISLFGHLAQGITVRGDKHRIATAIAAIIDNAIAFSPDNATITLGMTITTAGGLTLSVADQGAGLDPAEQARLANPFTQIDTELSRPHNGLGLGLFLARGIMHLHGGNLTLTSMPGKGTQVQFILPPARVSWAAISETTERATV